MLDSPNARARRAVRAGFAGWLVIAALACGGSEAPPEEPAPAAAAQPSAALPPPQPVPAPPPPPSDQQLAALQARVTASPDDAELRRRYAIALFSAKRRAAAVEQFEQLASEVDDARAWIDLANAYGFVSRMDDAADAYRVALDRSPGNPEALFNLGEIAFLHGDADEAIEHYREALAAREDYLRAWYKLGRALEHQGDYREAYRTYGKALEGEPTTPEELVAYDDALYRMASLDIKMGAYQRAEEMLVALLEANPNHASAHYAYGQLLLQQGRLEEAQSQLQMHMALRAATTPTGQVATGD